MNILITTADIDFDTVMYFKDALGDSGKVFASNSIMSSALMKADEYVITPRISDESYINFLIDYCKENNITAIITRHDLDLIVLSKNKDLFKKNGITVIVSDEQVIKTCNDKWSAYQRLSSIGLKQPKTYIDIELLKQDLLSNVISFPLIMKPRWGCGSYSIFQIDDLDELEVLYRKTYRNIFRTFMKYESINAKEQCIIIQEKIDGVECGMDVLNDLNNNYVTTIAKKKLAIRVNTLSAEIVDKMPFENIAKKISENLKHIGNLDVDCFVTETGDIYVIDLNCRFGGQYVFSHFAGTNFPKQIIDWLEGLPTSPDNLKVEIGFRGSRDDSLIVKY